MLSTRLTCNEYICLMVILAAEIAPTGTILLYSVPGPSIDMEEQS